MTTTTEATEIAVKFVTHKEFMVIANALNFEAKHFDTLCERRKDVPEQTTRVWRAAAAMNRDISRRLLEAAR